MSTSAIASSAKIQTALTNLGIPEGFIAYDTVPLLRQLVVALGNVTTGGGGAAAWGSITGTLSNQTDLQSALNAKLTAANDLSDVANAATARTNLGVTATGADTTYAFRANNLSDLANAGTARTNLGLGTIATQAASAVAITGGTVTGLTSLGIRSTGAAFDLTLASDEVLTAGRTLKFNVGDGNRTLTIAESMSVAGRNVANTFTAAQTIAPSSAATCLTLSSGTITTSNPTISATQTWNNASTSFIGQRLAVIQTAFNSGIGTESWFCDWLGGAAGTTRLAGVSSNGGFFSSAGIAIGNGTVDNGGWHGFKSNGDSILCVINGGPVGGFGSSLSQRFGLVAAAKLGFLPSTTLAYTDVDAFFMRKDAATIQMGADAAGVTSQMFTAANRITSDGVGANLTIAPGNGRGGAGGSLILSTFTTAGAATAGTLTTRLTLDTAGLLTFADAVDMAFNTTTGTKIGTGATQKIGFWNATPVVQQVLATGAGATVDNVISFLQTIGLCKQS